MSTWWRTPAPAPGTPPAGPVPRGLWLLTDRGQAPRPLVAQVAAAVAGGVRTVVLREKDLPYGPRRDLADALRGLLDPVGGLLVVAGSDPLGGTARHLPDTPAGGSSAAAADTPAAGADTPYGGATVPADYALGPDGARAPGALFGWSWHGGAPPPDGVDYVTLSPVYATRSKPGHGPALGAAGLAAGVRRLGASVPVVALGGVSTAGQVRDCLAAGAHAVAVMGALMRADDPAALAATLVRAAAPAPAVDWAPPPGRPARRATPARPIPAARAPEPAPPTAAAHTTAGPVGPPAATGCRSAAAADGPGAEPAAAGPEGGR
ncbi:hypothetical protein GCM10010124_03160 [Pilimelia terevasa]|uniref:Thiamine phosphate synthase/TenI domain-containing protein n=1 Tax=Pilimelia terevasa TaxID=53372 RepID=A0A8J3BEL2_9ACTN|nr:hypothetical protein GCM10010124_03160 [Pilimelia terevasa]